MKWTIVRQELLTFHARHKRIRLTYEHDEEPGADVGNETFKRYRRHAQSILYALRDIFEGFPKGVEISSEKNPKINPLLSFDLPDKDRQNKFNRKVFLAYLAYWRRCLRDEGWIEGTEPYRAVSAIIAQVEGGKTKIEVDCRPEHFSKQTRNTEKTQDETEECRLNAARSTLVHLLSALPVLPHWDLWGLCSEQSDKNNGKKTLLSELERSISSVVYAAQLKYHSPSITEGESLGLLGYPARVRVCYAESGQDNQAPIFTTEEDFFTYCHSPSDKNNEKSLYLAYGMLIDATNIALLGESPDKGSDEDTKDKGTSQADPNNGQNDNQMPALSEPTSQQSGASGDEKKESVFFYVAYPITTSLGRRHFWHIWLRPDNPEATLEQLWTSWWPVHQRLLNWPILHAALASELEQLDIAYAQEEIQAEIARGGTAALKDESGKFNVEKLVCTYAYMLFPMRCVCDGDQVWGYEKYPIKQWSQVRNESEWKRGNLILGHQWMILKGKARGKNGSGKLKCKNDCLSYKKSQDPKNKYNPTILFYDDHRTVNIDLRHQHCHNLLEKQQYLVTKLLGSHSDEERIRQGNTKVMKENLRSLLLVKFMDQNFREHKLKEMESNGFAATNILATSDRITNPNNNDLPLENAKEIAEFLFGTDNPQEDFKRFISGDLHGHLSSILDLNPVKGYSHPGFPDLLKKYPSEIITRYIDREIKILDYYISITSDHPVATRISNIKELLRKWHSHISEKENHNYNCCEPFAGELAKLRVKHPSFTTNSEILKGKGASLMGKIPLLSKNNHPFNNDVKEFHLSIDEETIFNGDDFTEIVKYIEVFNKKAYFVFSLCKENKTIAQWDYAMHINYVAVMYYDDNVFNSHEHIKSTTKPNGFAQHLKTLGGHLFIATKSYNNYLWWRLEEDSWNPISDESAIRPKYKKDNWDKLYQLEFNVLLLVAFDGFYMEDNGSVQS